MANNSKQKIPIRIPSKAPKSHWPWIPKATTIHIKDDSLLALSITRDKIGWLRGDVPWIETINQDIREILH